MSNRKIRLRDLTKFNIRTSAPQREHFAVTFGAERKLNIMTTLDMITLTKRIVVLLFVTTLLAIVGVGCNTAHGFGKDMEKAGDKIQDNTK
jgi:predicted small secreted protein